MKIQTKKNEKDDDNNNDKNNNNNNNDIIDEQLKQLQQHKLKEEANLKHFVLGKRSAQEAELKVESEKKKNLKFMHLFLHNPKEIIILVVVDQDFKFWGTTFYFDETLWYNCYVENE